MSKVLMYLNKLHMQWETIHQISRKTGYRYVTIQRILSSQTISEKQEIICLIGLLATAEWDLKEIEELCRK